MIEQFTDGALVLLSGGQDSTTCLAWALDRFPTVETIGFDYRQRHSVELECRASVREGLGGLKVLIGLKSSVPTTCWIWPPWHLSARRP